MNLGHRFLIVVATFGLLVATALAQTTGPSIQSSQDKEGSITSQALGDPQRDLTFTPLPPCRIIDTRSGGGPLPAGTPGTARSFKVVGTTGFEAQGGTSGGCGVFSGVASVLINFVAVNPQGAGNLRGAAFPNAIPVVGSIVNYQALTPNLNIANAMLFPVCSLTGPMCTSDISLAANGAAVHVVADVLGYAAAPLKTQLETTYVNNGGDCPHNGDCTLSATCPALYTLTGGGHTTDNFVAGVYWKYNAPSGNQWSCQARNVSGVTQTIHCYAVCARVPGR